MGFFPFNLTNAEGCMLNNVKARQGSFDWELEVECIEVEDSEETKHGSHTDGLVAEAMASLFFKCKGYSCVDAASTSLHDMQIEHPATQRGLEKVQVKSKSLTSEDGVRVRRSGPNKDGRGTDAPYNIGDFDYLVAVIGCYIWVIPAWYLEKPGGKYATSVFGLKAGKWDRWRHNLHDAGDDFQKGEIKPLSFSLED